jgi:hypothetical protein
MAELVIGRIDQDHLRITISNRWSTNWFDANVEIKCGAWSGNYTATFENGELRSFASDIRRLYQDLSATVTFQQSEPYLSISCKGDGRGHIWLTGVAEERPHQGPKLVFQFGLEQTELPQIANSLDALDPRITASSLSDTPH